jgi:hypothetical protein
VSTVKQELDSQIEALVEAGIARDRISQSGNPADI